MLQMLREDGQEQKRTGVLSEKDAVEIWIARWLRLRPKHLAEQYNCDTRRLYEIWWGQRFPGSRRKAEQAFRDRYPGSVERTGFGYKRIPRVAAEEERTQLKLFE